ncbi:hypothetical protein MASR1M6_22970 [Rubrivivax sp.]
MEVQLAPVRRGLLRLAVRLVLARLVLALLALLGPCALGVVRADTRADAPPEARAARPLDILVLHSYSQEYPWTRRQHEGFLEGLAADAGRRYELRVETLDTKRVRFDAPYAQQMADHLAARYRGYTPAAIYVTDDNALVFALEHLLRLFPTAPVVFSGVNDFAVKARLDPARVTGVFERKEIGPNLELLRLMAPDVSEIVVVGDASETYRAIEQEMRGELAAHPGIRARFVADRQLERVLAGVRSGAERFLILTTLGAFVDARGQPLTLNESIPALAGLGRRAVISMEGVYLADGVLGGYVTSGRAQGLAAAGLVQRHLAGTPLPQLAPIEASPNEYLVDARELTRAGLTLPDAIAARATILHPLPSLAERFQREIVIALYLLAGMLLLTLGASLVVVLRKNRLIGAHAAALQAQSQRMIETQDSLVRAQRIAAMGSWDWRIAENWLSWSTEIYRIFGLEPAQFGASYDAFLERVHPEDRADVDTAVRRTLATGEPYDLTHRIVRPDGEVRVVRENAELTRDAQGRPLRMIGIVIDVTERSQFEGRLAYMANFDGVTGLPNRALFRERLAHALHTADRQQQRVALLFVDLDNFKHVNDSLGHAAGDALLQQVATRLTAAVRVSDTVSRLGGDEFTLVVEGLAQDEDAAHVAVKILEQSAQPYRLGEREVYVTASIGIAIYPRDGGDVDTLLMNADAAMYRAKENGRDGFEFFTQAISTRAQERLELGNELRGALSRGEFALHYQPKVAIEDGSVIGFEALLRWRNARLGAVSPAVFIPILEETGLIVEVGEWVLGEACRWAARLPTSDGHAPGVSVNLSARQFRHPGLDEVVQRALSGASLPAARLELEITESTLLDLQANLQTMQRLKALGVKLSIDDFGTGYSSLSYLKRFPVDRLKIDASFVRDVAEDPDDAAIVVAIVGLAHHLQLRVIAEGVESAEQLDFLRRQGCDEVQGYYFARPMPADEASAWLAAQTVSQGRSRPATAPVQAF